MGWLFSDIHANREALEACLDHARRAGIGRFIFLGDYVGYGADPGFAVDTIMREVDAGAAALLGNHDDAIASGSIGMNSVAAEALDWTRIQLNSAQREFLTQLPLTFEEGQRLFVHASAHAPEHWEYVTSVESASRNFMATRASQRSAVTFTSPPSSICHRPKKLPVSSRCNRLKSPTRAAALGGRARLGRSAA